MNLQRYETEIGRLPQRIPRAPIPWREGDYDGSERPLERDVDVEEQPQRKPARSDRSRRPRAAKTPVLWC
jgi:hypothetical protein